MRHQNVDCYWFFSMVYLNVQCILSVVVLHAIWIEFISWKLMTIQMKFSKKSIVCVLLNEEDNRTWHSSYAKSYCVRLSRCEVFFVSFPFEVRMILKELTALRSHSRYSTSSSLDGRKYSIRKTSVPFFKQFFSNSFCEYNF